MMDSYELEDLARNLCRMRGHNPHDWVMRRHYACPRWMVMLDEIQANQPKE